MEFLTWKRRAEFFVSLLRVDVLKFSQFQEWVNLAKFSEIRGIVSVDQQPCVSNLNFIMTREEEQSYV